MMKNQTSPPGPRDEQPLNESQPVIPECSPAKGLRV